MFFLNRYSNLYLNNLKNKSNHKKLDKLARDMNKLPCKTWKKKSKERIKCLTRKRKQKHLKKLKNKYKYKYKN